jgi:hypothetical protein
VAAAVARRTGGEHTVIAGGGHAVQRKAPGFNQILDKHLRAASAEQVADPAPRPLDARPLAPRPLAARPGVRARRRPPGHGGADAKLLALMQSRN